MLFSSITFLYYFLPVLLIIYLMVPSRFKNIVLLIFSLLFYFYGEPKYVFLLLLSCFLNYIGAIMIDKYRENSKLILIILVIYNIGQLLYFKYIDFFIVNVNNLFNTNIGLLRVVMPIGISFFTFQILSYVVDVYKKEVDVNRNFFEIVTYISLFPQLVAGPIVRYKTIESELRKRNNSYKDFSSGVKKFIIGLSKKVLIANMLGELCFDLTNMINVSVVGSWVNSIAFTLQIYFDFSGYSDMAIGMGRMFGFHFLENFNYPFIANSITDFWRRWHISLSSFFRDYIYIPMGGNRVNKINFVRNIFVVWFLTGFWHGASWNFIIWGIYFAVLLLFEKMVFMKYLDKMKLFRYVYTLFFVVVSFTIFNANSLSEVIESLKNMFMLKSIDMINFETIYHIRNYIVLIIIAIVSSTPVVKNIINNIKYKKVLGVFEVIYCFVLFLVVTAFLVDSSFNPFLYFRF